MCHFDTAESMWALYCCTKGRARAALNSLMEIAGRQRSRQRHGQWLVTHLMAGQRSMQQPCSMLTCASRS